MSASALQHTSISQMLSSNAGSNPFLVQVSPGAGQVMVRGSYVSLSALSPYIQQTRRTYHLTCCCQMNHCPQTHWRLCLICQHCPSTLVSIIVKTKHWQQHHNLSQSRQLTIKFMPMISNQPVVALTVDHSLICSIITSRSGHLAQWETCNGQMRALLP